MKVCTDACLFGAIVAEEISIKQQSRDKNEAEVLNDSFKKNKAEIFHFDQILDIGTGTGLLSLMLAQKVKGFIDAVELDEHAAQQAKENVAASPWPERICVHHIAIQHYNKKVNPANEATTHQLENNLTGDEARQKTYDYILSNPPFFQNALQSVDAKKNAAKHTPTLSFSELAMAIKENLHKSGKAFIMLPFHEMKFFMVEMERQNLFPQNFIQVQQTPTHSTFRTIAIFAEEKPVTVKESSIVIKDENNVYSEDFVRLLKDYYLNL